MNINETVGKLIVDWIVGKHPDLKRRLDNLPLLITQLGVERVIAEANRKPVALFVAAVRRSPCLGHIGAVHGENGQGANGMVENLLRQKKFIQGSDSFVTTPRPDNDIFIGSVRHHDVARETVNRSGDLVECDVLPTADKGKDGVFHSLENRSYSYHLPQ